MKSDCFGRIGEGQRLAGTNRDLRQVVHCLIFVWSSLKAVPLAILGGQMDPRHLLSVSGQDVDSTQEMMTL
jgi:hypothetical protein